MFLHLHRVVAVLVCLQQLVLLARAVDTNGAAQLPPRYVATTAAIEYPAQGGDRSDAGQGPILDDGSPAPQNNVPADGGANDGTGQSTDPDTGNGYPGVANGDRNSIGGAATQSATTESPTTEPPTTAIESLCQLGGVVYWLVGDTYRSIDVESTEPPTTAFLASTEQTAMDTVTQWWDSLPVCPTPDPTSFFIRTTPEVSELERVILVDGASNTCIATHSALNTVTITEDMILATTVQDANTVSVTVQAHRADVSCDDYIRVLRPRQQAHVVNQEELAYCGDVTTATTNLDTTGRDVRTCSYKCACHAGNCVGQQVLLAFMNNVQSNVICDIAVVRM